MCFFALLSFVILHWFGDKPAAGPIAAVIIGAPFTLAINHFLASQSAEKSRKSLIQALIAEIDALMLLISNRADMFQAQRRQAPSHYPYINVSEDYFTVFSKNADKLGMLPDLITPIVIMAYMEAKGLFDTVRLYSEENKKTMELRTLLQRTEGSQAIDPAEMQT